LTHFLEELLIDFRELIGEHSGENMAAIVWSTLELYKIQNKVRKERCYIILALK
jgi:hypothetical protein